MSESHRPTTSFEQALNARIFEMNARTRSTLDLTSRGLDRLRRVLAEQSVHPLTHDSPPRAEGDPGSPSVTPSPRHTTSGGDVGDSTSSRKADKNSVVKNAYDRDFSTRQE